MKVPRIAMITVDKCIFNVSYGDRDFNGPIVRSDIFAIFNCKMFVQSSKKKRLAFFLLSAACSLRKLCSLNLAVSFCRNINQQHS